MYWGMFFLKKTKLQENYQTNIIVKHLESSLFVWPSRQDFQKQREEIERLRALLTLHNISFVSTESKSI